MQKFVIGGNWKMQILQIQDAVTIAREIAQVVDVIASEGVEVFIAPSFTALAAVGQAIQGSKLKLAAQNMYYHDQGAFTGEISADSLVDAGCSYVLLGHSERRRIFGEDNATINLKVKKALQKGLQPVLCIGETAKEREQGRIKEVNSSQLQNSLADISAEQMRRVVIAYEPVWAINNKFLNPDVEIKTATPEQAAEVHRLVRQWLVTTYGPETGGQVPIQYGGSMKASNCQGLLEIDDINGGLIGGASLSAADFQPIIASAAQIYSS